MVRASAVPIEDYAPPDDGDDLLAYELQPSGVRFNEPVTLTVELAADEDLGIPVVYHISDESAEVVDGTLIAIDGDTGTVRVTAEVQHFSRIIVDRKGYFRLVDVSGGNFNVGDTVPLRITIRQRTADEWWLIDWREQDRISEARRSNRDEGQLLTAGTYQVFPYALRPNSSNQLADFGGPVLGPSERSAPESRVAWDQTYQFNTTFTCLRKGQDNVRHVGIDGIQLEFLVFDLGNRNPRTGHYGTRFARSSISYFSRLYTCSGESAGTPGSQISVTGYRFHGGSVVRVRGTDFEGRSAVEVRVKGEDGEITIRIPETSSDGSFQVEVPVPDPPFEDERADTYEVSADGVTQTVDVGRIAGYPDLVRVRVQPTATAAPVPQPEPTAAATPVPSPEQVTLGAEPGPGQIVVFRLDDVDFETTSLQVIEAHPPFCDYEHVHGPPITSILPVPDGQPITRSEHLGECGYGPPNFYLIPAPQGTPVPSS